MRGLLPAIAVSLLVVTGGDAASRARPPVLVMLGPPGAGKSTQAHRLAAAHGLALVATGDLLRAEAARKTPLGERIAAQIARGALVPNDVVDAVVKERLTAPDCARGVVLDGYPRTVAQARFLDALVRAHGWAPPTVLHLEAPDEVLIARLALRGRADDERDVIARRLATYRAEIAPIVSYYRGRDYHLVRGDQPVDDVFRALDAAVPRERR